jgi:hypothetical protein
VREYVSEKKIDISKMAQIGPQAGDARIQAELSGYFAETHCFDKNPPTQTLLPVIVANTDELDLKSVSALQKVVIENPNFNRNRGTQFFNKCAEDPQVMFIMVVFPERYISNDAEDLHPDFSLDKSHHITNLGDAYDVAYTKSGHPRNAKILTSFQIWRRGSRRRSMRNYTHDIYVEAKLEPDKYDCPLVGWINRNPNKRRKWFLKTKPNYASNNSREPCPVYSKRSFEEIYSIVTSAVKRDFINSNSYVAGNIQNAINAYV